MIESIVFKNFKILRDATLPLGRWTVLVGPNGSGKSTVLQALQQVRFLRPDLRSFASLAVKDQREYTVLIKLHLGHPYAGSAFLVRTDANGGSDCIVESSRLGANLEIGNIVQAIRVFGLDARAIARPAKVTAQPELAEDGTGLAAVLDHLRDTEPERFERLTAEFCGWLPEFDGIRFEKPQEGHKAIALRLRNSSARIPASDLSQGTLLALALLTLAHLPEPPSLIGLEEPDRGLHPRLLRHVRDAIYRLAYPEDVGEHRKPVQVIATTHSPYFLDLFRDHPQEVVIADRVEDNVRFERLSDRADLQEILGQTPLGEVWYTGILGGVPSER